MKFSAVMTAPPVCVEPRVPPVEVTRRTAECAVGSGSRGGRLETGAPHES